MVAIIVIIIIYYIPSLNFLNLQGIIWNGNLEEDF